MRRKNAIYLTAASFTVLSVAALAQNQSELAKQPLYLFMYARVTDHVNVVIADDQIHHVIAMVDKYRKANPDSHVSATLLFSGAVADALAKDNAKTHVVDFVKSYVRRGLIEVGYDGTDEPTYTTRPAVDFTNISEPEKRWTARTQAEVALLTEARDPITGAPEPGKAGGLKRMQQVFGEADCITGIFPLMKTGPGELYRPRTGSRVLNEGPKIPKNPPGLMPEVGGDSEAVQVIRTLNSKAMMFGLPDTNPAQVPGFRDARAGFSKQVSPLPDTPPELYWQDNVLRSSEASNDVIRLIHAANGPEAMQKLVDKADRSRVHVVHVVLAEEQNYLTPEFKKGPDASALEFAYNHPGSPQLPADALAAKTEVDAAYAKEDALLNWISGQMLPSNAGSRFVTSTDLEHMAAPANGFSISMEGLRKSLDEFIKQWGTDTFGPPLFQADGHYLSRAELFQVMADALAEYHRSGRFPESVKVLPVYGPVRLLTGHGPNAGDVPVAEVAAICSKLTADLHGQSAGDAPKNSIPIAVTVAGQMVNPAQFLRIMAKAILSPASSAEKIDIRMTYEFMAIGQLVPRSRPDTDDGFIWTLKPAQVDVSNGKSAGM